MDLESELADLGTRTGPPSKDETIARHALMIMKLRAALDKIADPSTSWGHAKLIAREALGYEKSNASTIGGGTCKHGVPLSWHCQQCADEQSGESK